MIRKSMMNGKRLLPLIAAGLMVTAGLFGFTPAVGSDHWDPEPPTNPDTGRVLLDTLDEFQARGSYGLWEVLSPDDAIQSSGAFRPSFYTTDRDYANIDLHTEIRTPLNPLNDNGFLGFVMNFKDPSADGHEYDAVIVDWNSKNLTSGPYQHPDSHAREGLTLYRIQGEVPDDTVAIRACFFAKDDGECPADIEVLDTFVVDREDREGGYRNTTENRGWTPGGETYEVRITIQADHPQATHTPGFIVSVKGGPSEDSNPYNGTFIDTLQASFDAEPAGVGFYTFNQGGSTNGAARFLNPEYADGIKPEIHVNTICPDGEEWFDGWCSAPVALEVDAVDVGSGIASVGCNVNGETLPDCDRDHPEPGVFDLDLSLFEPTGPTGNWEVSPDGTEVTQTNSGERVSYFTSQSGALPRDGLYLDVDYLGEIVAPASGAQDNIIGLSFGLTKPTGGGTLAGSYVIDWKAAEQTANGHTAPEGFTFYRIDGEVADTDAETFACYWGKDPAACDAATGGAAQLEVLDAHTGAGTGWEHDAGYTFRLEHYGDRVALTVQGGTNYATETTVIEVEEEGRFSELGHFGPFNFRQEGVTYRNLAFEELGQQVDAHGAELEVVAFDHAGNQAPVIQDLKMDLEAPDVQANADCSGENGWCNGDVSLSVEAEALSGILSTTCELDGSPSACSQTVSDDGIYTFSGEATSFVRRTGSDTTTFQRDATAPEGAIVEPVPGCSYVDDEETVCLGATTVIGSITFNVTATDPDVNGVSSGLERAEFYENGEPFTTVTSNGSGWLNTTWTPSETGDRTVEVRLIDTAGNVETLEFDALVLL